MRLNAHTGKPRHASSFDSTSQKTNNTVAISTPKLLLVPYSAHHVPTYHTWMQDPELQTATASEPLTLDQEFEMQRSWRTDNDKLTFIVCLPLSDHTGQPEKLEPGVDDGGERMVGDVNLFLSELEPDEDEDEVQEQQAEKARAELVGEIELMIALKPLQNQGYGRAALLTFMAYILSHWKEIAREYSRTAAFVPLAYLRARIHESNERSIRLFESVGFKRTAEGANYFGEIELRRQGDVEALKGCKGWVEGREVRYG